MKQLQIKTKSLPPSKATANAPSFDLLQEQAKKDASNGNWRRRTRRRIRKRMHDMTKCKQATRTAWHEAGHALIALMNHPKSISSLEFYGGKSFDGCLGVCRLEDLTPFGHCADYMPPELDLAGVVAECILTGEDFYDAWWSFEAQGQTDATNFEEKCLNHDLDYRSQMDEMVQRTFSLLISHRGILRKVADKLMRCKCLSSYEGSWLNMVGLSLTPMPNSRLHDVFRRREQLIQQLLEDEAVLDTYYMSCSKSE